MNASLITCLRLPPLIVTLGTYSLFRGLAEAITHGVDTFTNFPASFLQLGQERAFGVPPQVWLFVGVAAGIGCSYIGRRLDALFVRLALRRRARATPDCRWSDGWRWPMCWRTIRSG